MVKRSNARRAPQGSVRIIAGEWRSRRLRVADGHLACGRHPIACARPCSIGCATRSSVRGAWISMPAPARSVSRRCRAARREACFIERDPVLDRRAAAHAEAFGVSPRIVRQDSESLLPRHGRAALRLGVSRSAVRAPLPAGAGSPAALAQRARLVYVERPRAEGLPAIQHGDWWKRSRAGAVEYGLLQLRVRGRRMTLAQRNATMRGSIHPAGLLPH